MGSSNHVTMNTLPLRPLPSETCEKSRVHHRLRSEGFVDEEMVAGVIARGAYERAYVQPEGMVLSSNEDDYAGWSLPVPSPFRGMQEIQASPPAPVRRPAPPVAEFSEPGIETPYAGGHRWWLFGASGALTCSVLALTLLSLAQRTEFRELAEGYVPSPIKAEVTVIPAKEPAIQPSLTKAQTDFR